MLWFCLQEKLMRMSADQQNPRQVWSPVDPLWVRGGGCFLRFSNVLEAHANEWTCRKVSQLLTPFGSWGEGGGGGGCILRVSIF